MAITSGGLGGRTRSSGSRGYVVFPLLTAITVLLSILAVYWHALVIWLVGVVVLDVGVRLFAANRVATLAVALRQIAPIVVTGEQLAFLHGDEIASIVGTISADTARLRRLKTIARWLSGEPFLTSDSSGLTMLATLASAVYEYLNLLLLLDANGVYFATVDARKHGAALVRLVSSIGTIDTAI